MKKLQIIYYKATYMNATWLDKLIAIWTRGRYSHTEIVMIGEDCVTPTMFSSSNVDDGVRSKRHHINHDAWEYEDFLISDETYNKILSFFKEIDGKKYDYPGVFGFVIKFIKQKQNKWFCSETTAEVLKLMNVEPFTDKPSYSFTPNGLYRALNPLNGKKLKRITT